MGFKDDLQSQWREISKGFGSGRHRQHKLMAVAGYAFICLLTVAWSFSGGGALSNPIGAEVSSNTVELNSETWLQLRNLSDDTWTGLQLELNEGYRASNLSEVQPGDSIQVFVRDFTHADYIPRPKVEAGAQRLTTTPERGPTAPPDLQPKTLRISTDQGFHRVAFADETAADANDGDQE